MRLYFAIVLVILSVGCQSPRDATTRIANSLERSVTEAEARHILLNPIEQAIEAGYALRTEDGRVEAEILSRKRQELSSRFDLFLSRSRSGDELWAYRTSLTPDGRGGKSGFALVRAGRVVEYMDVWVYD